MRATKSSSESYVIVRVAFLIVPHMGQGHVGWFYELSGLSEMAQTLEEPLTSQLTVFSDHKIPLPGPP